VKEENLETFGLSKKEIQKYLRSV